MIINADDYCLNDSVTDAIKQSIDLHIVDRTTCLVNFNMFENIITDDWSKQRLELIGLHLNLTEGQPLTNEIKKCNRFVDSNGFFKNNLKNRKGMRVLFLSKKEREALAIEIEAQFQLFRKFNKKSVFFDSHHHIHTVYSVFKIISPIAKKYGFTSTRISKNIGLTFKKPWIILYKRIINSIIKKSFDCQSYFGSYNDYKNYNKRDDFKNNLEIMCHPDIKNGELIDLSSSLNMLLYMGIKDE